MSKLTAKQVRERLTTMLGSNMLVEGTDPSTAMSGVLEIIDSYEIMETEQSTHETLVGGLNTQIDDYKGKLVLAQETNLKLLKRVDNSDTMGVGNKDNRSEETHSIEQLLSDNNKED